MRPATELLFKHLAYKCNASQVLGQPVVQILADSALFPGAYFKYFLNQLSIKRGINNDCHDITYRSGCITQRCRGNDDIYGRAIFFLAAQFNVGK